VPSINPFKVYGRVNQMVGILLEVGGITPCIGETCVMCPGEGTREMDLEVVGFRGGRALMMPVGAVDGVGPGCRVETTGRKAEAMVGAGLAGRVIDGLGNPMDGKGPVPAASPRSLYGKEINPFTRARIEKPLDVGIRAINSLLTVGKGQRMGIMAGSGVGKSVLLGMMAKYTTADINVIALIGERGREVREFIERDLGTEGLARSVVVVATSDQPPLMRLRAAFLATSAAEYFRDMGRDVLLMMDSATRVAMAQREIGLAAGEPPTTKGYPPSAFALLPKLLERAGTDDGTGSITGFYTVLAEGDDMNDPVADAMRSILDGHIVLSRDIAARGHYPAIDVLQSISRVMPDIVDDNQIKAARRFVEVMADYARNEDLINIGAYKPGSSPKIDFALAMKDRMDAFLRQGLGERATTAETLRDLFRVFE
jgi:flagellum-specific ATP synthase